MPSALEKLLFKPCKTKDDLKNWLKLFLDIELPDVTVDPTSNSNPFDFLWEVYSKGQIKNSEDFTQVLSYASRDSMKTKSMSLLETLSLLHLDRDIVHLAAIAQQSAKSMEYLFDDFSKPIIRDYVTRKSERRIEITKYKDANKNIISPKAWDKLEDGEKDKYKSETHHLQVIVATMASTNGSHAQLCVADEMELIPNYESVLEEFKMVPTVGKNGELPITIFTSSRKFGFGPVQKMIDTAEKTGTHIRHWSIIDVTEKCPPSRHLPNEPKIPIYVNDNILTAISEDELKLLTPDEQIKFEKQEGFAGCLSRCKLFSVCKTALALKQTSTAKMLKPIPLVIAKFREVDTEVAKAQLLSRKPSSEGLIFPKFDPAIHVISAAQMIQKITGEENLRMNTNKRELVQLMGQLKMEFVSGADWGFTHRFSVVTGWTWNNILYIFDVISVSGLEIMEKIELVNSKIRYLNPTIYADPAYPSDIKTFKKHGYNMRDFVKDVQAGINAVRSKLTPNLGVAPQLFILSDKESPGTGILIRELSQMHWKTDSAGNLTDVPDKENDDSFDALKYLVQNLFAIKNKVLVAGTELDQDLTQGQDYTINNWMSKTIAERTDDSSNDSVKIKKGGSNFSF